jgi:hypothetical protein
MSAARGKAKADGGSSSGYEQGNEMQEQASTGAATNAVAPSGNEPAQQVGDAVLDGHGAQLGHPDIGGLILDYEMAIRGFKGPQLETEMEIKRLQRRTLDKIYTQDRGSGKVKWWRMPIVWWKHATDYKISIVVGALMAIATVALSVPCYINKSECCRTYDSLKQGPCNVEACTSDGVCPDSGVQLGETLYCYNLCQPEASEFKLACNSAVMTQNCTTGCTRQSCDRDGAQGTGATTNRNQCCSSYYAGSGQYTLRPGAKMSPFCPLGQLYNCGGQNKTVAANAVCQ